MKFTSILLVACFVITLTEAAPKKDRDGKSKKGKDSKGKKEKKGGKSGEMELGCHRVWTLYLYKNIEFNI